MKNKKIIIGKSGSGKSYTALLLALQNKHTTIIGNGVTGISRYIDDFSELSDFTEKIYNPVFSIQKDSKYFINCAKNSADGVKFINSIIFGCDYGVLKNDKDAAIVYDDGLWNYQENQLLALWKLSHTRCKIIITVDSWEELLHIPEKEITSKMKSDILKKWSIIECINSRGV